MAAGVRGEGLLRVKRAARRLGVWRRAGERLRRTGDRRRPLAGVSRVRIAGGRWAAAIGPCSATVVLAIVGLACFGTVVL
jgi:hypothetical protein